MCLPFKHVASHITHLYCLMTFTSIRFVMFTQYLFKESVHWVVFFFSKVIVYTIPLFQLQWEAHEKAWEIWKTLSIHKTLLHLLIYTNWCTIVKVQKKLLSGTYWSIVKVSMSIDPYFTLDFISIFPWIPSLSLISYKTLLFFCFY